MMLVTRGLEEQAWDGEFTHFSVFMYYCLSLLISGVISMRRLSYLLMFMLLTFLSGCDSSIGDNAPRYVKEAKSDLKSALIADVFKTPEFTCESRPENNSSWSIGCFDKVKKPSVFFLFAVPARRR